MINWAYVAGFFDGEGSVECRQYRVSLYQKDRKVLDVLSEWFQAQGIRCAVYGRAQKRITNFGVWDEGHSLRIQDAESLKTFLYNVLPYSIVKRQLCLDLWRQLIIFPKLNPSTIGKLGRQNSTSQFGMGWHGKISRDVKTGRWAKCQAGAT